MIFQWTRHLPPPALEVVEQLEMVVKVPMIMKRRNGDVQPKESLENKGEQNFKGQGHSALKIQNKV